MARNVTGQGQAKAVLATVLEGNFPIYVDAAGAAGTNTFAVAAHVINNSALSGKKYGALALIAKKDYSTAAAAVAAGDYTIVMATGSKSTDPWVVLTTSTGTGVTPA